MLTGIDEMEVTKRDGFDSLAWIKIATAYKLGRKTLTVPPSDSRQLAGCEPVYIEMTGWQKPTHEAKTWPDLPRNAQLYLKKLADLTAARLVIASVGPNRDQTIVL